MRIIFDIKEDEKFEMIRLREIFHTDFENSVSTKMLLKFWERITLRSIYKQFLFFLKFTTYIRSLEIAAQSFISFLVSCTIL